MAAKINTVVSVKLSAADIAAMTPAQRRELLGQKPSQASAFNVDSALAWLGGATAKTVNAVSGAPSAFALGYKLNRVE